MSLTMSVCIPSLQAARREREKFVAEMEGRGLNQRVGTQSSNVEIVTITADTKQDPSAKDDLKEKVGSTCTVYIPGMF